MEDVEEAVVVATADVVVAVAVAAMLAVEAAESKEVAMTVIW
jgi:hypothetical protein